MRPAMSFAPCCNKGSSSVTATAIEAGISPASSLASLIWRARGAPLLKIALPSHFAAHRRQLTALEAFRKLFKCGHHSGPLGGESAESDHFLQEGIVKIKVGSHGTNYESTMHALAILFVLQFTEFCAF